ncbi:uncharacterized protein LOC111331169 isoform X3 [Stylophora pistillata]|uniref:uncharacterized protein LOC111331169 isoform X3 n=1 Tax=Stylophora pistillata TaxID=50429 RepID=UPI000C04F199|nr:uncharacterized protein LOC111331169 isoform X3 [Stylophora pistillata]
MDYSAVNTASDEQLQELGPLRRGDLLSLRSFVNEKLRGESRDEKKRKLLDLLKKRVKPKKKRAEEKASTEPGPSNQIINGYRKVQFGWLHYDPQQNRYITNHALTTVRLYLMTRSVEKESQGCDAELPEVFEVDRKPTKVHAKKECNDDANHGGLMGTCAERETIKAQQDREYEESLAADRAKEKQKLEIEEATKRQMELQAARKRRLPPEPVVNEARAVVSVRHVTLGIQRRAFRASDEMGAVYDWIGSLSTKPESFALSGCGLPELMPSLSVMVADKSILNMQETQGMPSYPEDGLNFLGFGNLEDLSNLDVTVPDLWCTMDDFNFNATLPTAFMERDFATQNNPEVTHVTEDRIPSVVNSGGTKDSSLILANSNATDDSSASQANNSATQDSSPSVANNNATQDSSPSVANNNATQDSSPRVANNKATQDSSPSPANNNATEDSNLTVANNDATQDSNLSVANNSATQVSNPSRTTQRGTRHSQTNRVSSQGVLFLFITLNVSPQMIMMVLLSPVSFSLPSFLNIHPVFCRKL